MRSRNLRIILFCAMVLAAGLVCLFTYSPPISQQHGIVETKLYLGESDKQPLIVAFGGGDGGNDWSRNYMKEKRDELTQQGYAIVAVGYFRSNGTPQYLDRISLDAIADTILNIAKHPKIDESKIALIGGSKGGELVLNLASRFDQFKAVVALSTSNVSFPAITWSANTSSWMYQNKELPYVPAPFKTIFPALKGDLYTAHSMMLEDEKAVENAEIPVENIAGPILLLSAVDDEQWPATAMSNRIMERLKEKGFRHKYHHLKLTGGHIEPLNHFDKIYEFLNESLN